MMWRLRDYLRTESLGIVIPVAFISLWVVWQVIIAFVWSFIYPILVKVFGQEGRLDRYGLEFEALGIDFQPDTFLVNLLSAALLGIILYRIVGNESFEPDDPQDQLRECPECKSDIFVTATRCAFCTAAVKPIDPQVIDADG